MSFRLPLIFLLLVVCSGHVAIGEGSDEALRTDRPVVTVLAPPGLAYFVDAGQEAKIVVVVEITDATRQGVKTDDAGWPAFVAPDANVEAFSRNVTNKTEFVDRLGHPVMQITSLVPLKALKVAEQGGISPPTDIWKTPPGVTKNGYDLPQEAIAPVAKFRFVVEDRAGMRSDSRSERCLLFVAFPCEVFVPPASERDEQRSKGGGTKKPVNPPKPPASN